MHIKTGNMEGVRGQFYLSRHACHVIWFTNADDKGLYQTKTTYGARTMNTHHIANFDLKFFAGTTLSKRRAKSREVRCFDGVLLLLFAAGFA